MAGRPRPVLLMCACLAGKILSPPPFRLKLDTHRRSADARMKEEEEEEESGGDRASTNNIKLRLTPKMRKRKRSRATNNLLLLKAKSSPISLLNLACTLTS